MTNSPKLTDNPSFPRKIAAIYMIAAIMFIYFLNWAEPFFVTLFLSILLAYVLNPLVTQLEKVGLKRIFSVSLTLSAFLALIIFSSYALSNQFDAIINQTQQITEKWSGFVHAQQRDGTSNFHKLEIAAKQVEQVTETLEESKRNFKPITLIVNQKAFKVSDYVLKGSIGILGFIGSFLTVIFLSFFLLISTDMMKRKLVRIIGNNFSHKRITVEIIQEINSVIQKYISMLFVTNALLGALVYLALKIIGLENAGGWAIGSAFIHFIPYFGPLIITLLLGMSSFLQFGDWSITLILMMIIMFLTTFVGVLITTWMTGKFSQVNSVCIFLSLIFFTWLWGIAGMLLAIPIIVSIKVISDHIDTMKIFSELLSK